MGTVSGSGGYVDQTKGTADQRVEDLDASDEEATFLAQGLKHGASIVVVDCPTDQLDAGHTRPAPTSAQVEHGDRLIHLGVLLRR